MITIYPDEPCSIPVSYESDPLAVYDKTFTLAHETDINVIGDIEDVLMCFKQNVNDPEDKYIVKYYRDGNGRNSSNELAGTSGEVTIDTSTYTLTMVKLETDVVMPSTTLYSMHIGVKVKNLNKWLTLRVKRNNENKIRVEPDEIFRETYQTT